MTRYPLVLVVAMLGACGGDKPPVDQSIAKAMDRESKQQKIDEEAKERDRQERVAKAAEKKAAEARLDAELEAIAVLPDTMPPDLAAACDAVVTSYDDFMKRGRESDVDAWHQHRRAKLGERRQTCGAQGSLTVAACQSRALTGDPPSLADVERTEAALLVMQRCADKFGKS